MDKNGHFSSHPKMIISSATMCLSKMSSIPVGGTLHAQLQDPAFNSSSWHIPVIAQKHWSCFPLFFPWLIMKLRQGCVANLVYKKCSTKNCKRGGGVWVGQKWGGWVQSWVGGSCPK